MVLKGTRRPAVRLETRSRGLRGVKVRHDAEDHVSKLGADRLTDPKELLIELR